MSTTTSKQSDVVGDEDMILIDNLNEEAILNNIHLRFVHDLIYVCIMCIIYNWWNVMQRNMLLVGDNWLCESINCFIFTIYLFIYF